MIYKGFGRKLHHDVPHWVESGAVFHIRIRCDESNKISLIDPAVAAELLKSVRVYESKSFWHPHIWLLMPDHLHALLTFALDKAMAETIGNWKRYQAKKYGIVWQENFFDHRIRDDDQLMLKRDYIRNNPVVKGLCAKAEDWPWSYAQSIVAADHDLRTMINVHCRRISF